MINPGELLDDRAEGPAERTLERTLDRTLNRASTAAEAYRLATGVSCIVIDQRGRPANAVSHQAGCEFCRSLERCSSTDDEASSCSRLHLYGAVEAERFGGYYIYLCSIGMINWASPLYCGGLPAGALIGGPIRLIDRDEALATIRDACPDSINAEAIAACVDAIPAVGAERIQALAELLAMAASHASERESADLDGARCRNDQQARISESIHAIKSRTVAGAGEKVGAYPVEKERELLSAIRRGDEADSRRILNDLLGVVFFADAQRFEAIRFRGLELVVLLSRAAMEAGAEAEAVLGLNFRYLRRFQDLNSIEDLAYLLDKILGRFMNLSFSLRTVKHAAAIKRALNFIYKRCAGPIGLLETAAAAGLAPAYFSKIFKAELGESFSAYVNRLRVERAVPLLTDTDLDLPAVAGAVGFEDQSYFNKVFKRLMGIPPGRYREAGGRRPAELQEIHESATAKPEKGPSATR